jgi:Restriction Enzyme Adenine Methylase Associated
MRKLFRSIRISISDQDHERTLQTLALLSKEKMGERLPASGQENLLNVLWNAHFVDRKVKGAVEALFRNEDPGLLRLLRKNTSGLKPNEIRASLKRAVPIRVDFPEVPVGDYPAAAPRKPIRERVGARTRKAPLLTVVDKAKQKTPISFETKLSDLIQVGLCQTPLQLEREYKGVHLKAVVQNDGTVSVKGELYDSLSTAGGMAWKSVIGSPPGRPYPQTNGWTFWKLRDLETGKLIEIDVLRQKYLKRSIPDFVKA